MTIGDARRWCNKRLCNNQPKKDSAAGNVSKSAVSSWQKESVAGACGKCNDGQINGMRSKGNAR